MVPKQNLEGLSVLPPRCLVVVESQSSPKHAFSWSKWFWYWISCLSKPGKGWQWYLQIYSGSVPEVPFVLSFISLLSSFFSRFSLLAFAFSQILLPWPCFFSNGTWFLIEELQNLPGFSGCGSLRGRSRGRFTFKSLSCSFDFFGFCCWNPQLLLPKHY